MGHTAALFHSNSADKQTLDRRVRPSDDQFEEQQKRWNELARYLVRAVGKRFKYPISTWLQGSYKFGTQVRPPRMDEEFDIDLGLYLAWDDEPHAGEDPAEVRSVVQDCLLKAGSELEGIVELVSPPKARCSRVRYEGGFHIDVPAYHLHPARRDRTLATDQGWEDSDPETIYDWWCNQFTDYERDKARRIVRYLKVWSRLKFPDEAARPSSILITVLVGEALPTLTSAAWASDDDGLRNATAAIISRLRTSPVVGNPVSLRENLAGRLKAQAFEGFVVELERLLGIADRALSAESILDAAGIWQEAFEHFFPLPEATFTSDSVALTKVSSMAPQVRVTATLKKNSSVRYEGRNEIGPIPRGCTIVFEIEEPWLLPPGAHVTWTVRNEGEEAEDVNDMGHAAGTGYHAQENSAYNGRHYMDCVVKSGVHVVGWRRVPVVVNGPYLTRKQRRAQR